MDKNIYITRLLAISALIIGCAESENLSIAGYGVNRAGPQSVLTINNNKIQSQLLQGTNDNFYNHASYSYISPTSTYAAYTAMARERQTANPSMFNLNSDSYKNIETAVKTYLLSRIKGLELKHTEESQKKLLLPRYFENQTNMKHIETQANIGNISPIMPRNPQTPTECIQNQFGCNFQTNQQENQQNWRPLPQLRKKENPYVDSTSQESLTLADLCQLIRGAGKTTRNNLSNNLPFQPYSSGHENLSDGINYKTVLRSHAQGQGFDVVATPPADLFQYTSSIQNIRNRPITSSMKEIYHQRVDFIKSLLADYLALSQSRIPMLTQTAPVNLNKNDVSESSLGSKFSLDSRIPAHSPTEQASPAVSEHTNFDLLNRQRYYQTQSTIPAIRQPHTVYGTPINN